MPSMVATSRSSSSSATATVYGVLCSLLSTQPAAVKTARSRGCTHPQERQQAWQVVATLLS